MYRRNVLIFHQAALGDFVLAWPLAVALGRLYPQSRVAFVAPAGKGKLAERVLGVDAMDAEAGWPGLFMPMPTDLPANVTTALSRSQAIFDFLAGPDSAWAVNVKRLAPGATVTHLPTRPAADYARHATENLVESLENVPAVRSAVEQILRSIRDRGVATRRAVGDAVVIHPGSGSPAKNWPVERFIEVATWARGAGKPVRFVLGEVERERWPAVDIAALAAVGEVVIPPDYLALHAALVDAAVYVGNDSGPSHLAAMCGVPTVALFVSTDPRVWSPVGPRVETVVQPSADDVWNAVRRLGF
jgi:heptosyltransferase-3